MTDEEKKKYYQVVADCWKLFLKYGSPVEAQQYWENLSEDARTIAQRYGEQPFVKEQLFSVLNEIDRLHERSRYASKEKT